MMNKAELEKRVEEQQKIIDKQKKRVREQNQRAKELWDCVSCRLPKGTRKRIETQGISVNGFINKVVLEALENMELKTNVTRIEANKEALDIFGKYGKKYVLSGLGQKELAEKYGEETAKKVIDYAMRQS